MFIIKFFYLLQKINEAWNINKKAGDAEIASLFSPVCRAALGNKKLPFTRKSRKSHGPGARDRT